MSETDEDYLKCRFSITCHADDLAVVHCLRALCEFAERGVRGQIGWAVRAKMQWRRAGNEITLRFSDPAFRDAFVEVANEILRPGLWSEVRRSDSDPAIRRR